MPWPVVGEQGEDAQAHFLYQRWAVDRTFDWDVIEYSDIDADQQKVEALEQLHGWHYFAAKTISGTKIAT